MVEKMLGAFNSMIRSYVVENNIRPSGDELVNEAKKRLPFGHSENDGFAVRSRDAAAVLAKAIDENFDRLIDMFDEVAKKQAADVLLIEDVSDEFKHFASLMLINDDERREKLAAVIATVMFILVDHANDKIDIKYGNVETDADLLKLAMLASIVVDEIATKMPVEPENNHTVH